MWPELSLQKNHNSIYEKKGAIFEEHVASCGRSQTHHAPKEPYTFIQTKRDTFYQKTLSALDAVTFEEPEGYIQVHGHTKGDCGLCAQMLPKQLRRTFNPAEAFSV